MSQESLSVGGSCIYCPDYRVDSFKPCRWLRGDRPGRRRGVGDHQVCLGLAGQVLDEPLRIVKRVGEVRAGLGVPQRRGAVVWTAIRGVAACPWPVPRGPARPSPPPPRDTPGTPVPTSLGIPDDEFSPYGLAEEDITVMRLTFSQWPRDAGSDASGHAAHQAVATNTRSRPREGSPRASPRPPTPGLCRRFPRQPRPRRR